MPNRHPESQLLHRFLRGEASLGELQDLVWHLVETCPDCADAIGATGAHKVEAPVRSSAGGSVGLCEEGFERLRAQVRPTLAQMAHDRQEAPGLLEELERHPIERQRILVRNTPRFHNLVLADSLLEVAWERRIQESSQSENLVGLALEVLDRVDPATFTDGLLNDLRGRAWAYLGNLFRMRSALGMADEAFVRAEHLLSDGTGDPLEAARLIGLRSTLRRVQRRFVEADGMLQESLAIYETLGENHLAGRTMVTQALLLDEQGDSAAALSVLRRAQDLIEPDRDPYLVRVVQQNIVTYLMALGSYEEAMNLIPALRRRMVESGTRKELLYLRWQEGRLLLGLGHEARAEAAFLEIRKAFVEQGIAHDAASASLELASLYLRQGRTAEIRELARQMVPIFQSRELPQRAIAALLLFQRAVEMDTLTLRMVEEVADNVRRAQGKPRSRQHEPS